MALKMNSARQEEKILVLSEVFPPQIGGSGRWLYEIYSCLPPGLAVMYVGGSNNAKSMDAEYKHRVLRGNLTSREWTFMSRAGFKYFFNLFRNSQKLLRSTSINQVHCARVIPEGVVGLALGIISRTQLVCYVHGEDIELARTSRETRVLVQQVIKRADRIICNSENSRRLLIDHWVCNENNIAVLHPAIDAKKYCPAQDVAALRKKYDLSERKVLITVSRLEKRKGHDAVLRCIPSLVSSNPSLIYLIVGDGIEYDFLNNLCKELNIEQYVRFHTDCSDAEMLEFLQCSDVFILANRQVGTSIEGFGIVLLEAQSCGLPVIAGKSGGTSEAFVDGQTGFLVDCTNTDELGKVIQQLLVNEDKTRKLGETARVHVKQHHDWEVITELVRQKVYLQ